VNNVLDELSRWLHLPLLIAGAMAAGGCSSQNAGERCADGKCDQSASIDAGDPGGGEPDAAPAIDPAVIEACDSVCERLDVCHSAGGPPCVEECLGHGRTCDGEAAAVLASCAEMTCDDVGGCLFTTFDEVACFAVCGDEFCQASEDCESCPSDCGENCEGTCNHDVCAEGTGLEPDCSPCAQMVCAADPSCCEEVWFSHSCHALANDLCGARCEIPPERGARSLRQGATSSASRRRRGR
jgi:hypothetical protein